jgi:hypothetical protein
MALLDIPTEEFFTRADALVAGALGFKKKYVHILEDEEYGGEFTFNYYNGRTLITLYKPEGEVARGIPAGGTEGQMLVKKSNDDFDTKWVDVPIFETHNLKTSSSGSLLVAAGVRLKVSNG